MVFDSVSQWYFYFIVLDIIRILQFLTAGIFFFHRLIRKHYRQWILSKTTAIIEHFLLRNFISLIEPEQ